MRFRVPHDSEDKRLRFYGVREALSNSLGGTSPSTGSLTPARLGFEELLGRHVLAFADHAAEFYAGSGMDYQRALELARANVAIVRPGLRSSRRTRSR